MESFSILTINKWYEGDKVTEFFTFSHYMYTFQEFFAAYYLTTLPHEEQMLALELYQSIVFSTNVEIFLWSTQNPQLKVYHKTV